MLIIKIHNTINHWDTIFALLAPFDRNTEKNNNIFYRE